LFLETLFATWGWPEISSGPFDVDGRKKVGIVSKRLVGAVFLPHNSDGLLQFLASVFTQIDETKTS
jgi:hypothetical protein